MEYFPYHIRVWYNGVLDSQFTGHQFISSSDPLPQRHHPEAGQPSTAEKEREGGGWEERVEREGEGGDHRWKPPMNSCLAMLGKTNTPNKDVTTTITSQLAEHTHNQTRSCTASDPLSINGQTMLS